MDTETVKVGVRFPRDHSLAVRFTETEYQTILQASAAERSLSDWIRGTLLKAAQEPKEGK